MTGGWNGAVPSLTAAQHDFLRVARAAAGGRVCDPPPLSWEAVLELAHTHKIADFLYPRVAAWPLPLQPPPADRARWRSAFFGAVARYERSVVQTRGILSALREAGVRVIPLKGIWLAERAYGDGACRRMNDIDLLVAPSGLGRARAVVERLGYATDDFSPGKAAGGRHLRFRKPDAPLPLELHWRLLQDEKDGDGGDADGPVWEGLEEASLHGVPVSVFPVEREIVYLARHLLHHAWAVPLKSHLDLSLLCARFGAQVSAARLAREADAWGIPFGTRFVLRVAADLFGEAPFAAVAPFLQEAAACGDARRAALAAAVQISSGSARITPALAAALPRSRAGRLAAGFGRVWLTPDQIRLIYPRTVRRWGLPGGYLWRGADLARRHGAALLGRRRIAPEEMANSAIRHTLVKWIDTRDAELRGRADGRG